MEHFLFNVIVLACLSLSAGSKMSSASRFCVIENRVGNQTIGAKRLLAFRSNTVTSSVSVEVSYGNADFVASSGWSPWKTLGAPSSSKPLSNPSCIFTEQNQTQIFVQASDGQIYSATQDKVNFLDFSAWKKVGINAIPANQPKQPMIFDSVTAVWFGKELMVFARSISVTSRLYWCKGTATSCRWGLVAGSALLGTDATMIKNTYTTKYEGFMISPAGRMHRTWQHSGGNSFKAWKAMSSSPTFSILARPMAQTMGYNYRNGKIMIGAVGRGGYVYRCAQAACDMVDNPWSYCTWGSWTQTGKKIPFEQKGVQNNLVMSRNLHYGVEIFAVELTNGQLWQTWQPSRDTSWNVWRKIPHNLTTAAFINNPYFRVNDAGWWIAYGLNDKDQVIEVSSSHSMSISSKRVAWAGKLVVSWAISEDQASRKDWIGIFPKGARDNQYLDYRYVQGGQNPGSRPVSKGDVSMSSNLPNGSYQVRYLMNRKYTSIMELDVTYYNESGESDLMQLFRGIYIGLEIGPDHFRECVEETLHTVQMFRDAFIAFNLGEVYQGLQLLGTALEDIAQSLTKCNELRIAQKLLEYIKDLLSCMMGNCLKFTIDMLEELLILFLHRYEIYGDIQAATNSFAHGAYQQGGLSIGRFVIACLFLEDSSLLLHGGRQGAALLDAVSVNLIEMEEGRNGTHSGSQAIMKRSRKDTGSAASQEIRFMKMHGINDTLSGSLAVMKRMRNNTRSASQKMILLEMHGANIFHSGNKKGGKPVEDGIGIALKLMGKVRNPKRSV
ncbi:uncharacterized protein LOC121430788 [Lytechinus variegatus]|uniref:uncharacterized protein LOC121430788 n=1 Tax=Lytechinus variegatus TaxID=7654 RepID=UPI001BB2A823|nr:uncharacterized protein LOC121430788 [Lytechinus variegatus]